MQQCSLTLLAGIGLVLSSPCRSQIFAPLLKEALEQHPTLQQQNEELRMARIQKEAAYSGFYPRVLAGASSSTQEGQGLRHSVSLGATQTLFGGGAEYSELNRLEKAIQVQEAELEDAKDRVRIQVASALLQGSLAAEKQRILEDSQSSLQKRLSELQRRVRLGQSREPDLIQAQLENGRIERQLIDAQGMLATARRDLSLTLMKEAPSFQFPALDALLRELHTALQPREEFERRSLEVQIEAHKHLGRSLWRNYLPMLGAFATTYPQHPNGGVAWEAGLRAEWTLFEGFKTPKLLELHEAEERQLEQRLAQLQFSRKKNLEQLRLEVQHARAKRASISQTLEGARRALRIQQADYRRGIVTELEVQTSLQVVLDLTLEEAELRNRAGYLLTESLKNGARL